VGGCEMDSSGLEQWPLACSWNFGFYKRWGIWV